MARIEKEVVLGGKGYIFVNGIPFAYASGFELRGEYETSQLARSHALIPDRILYKGASFSLSVPVKQVLLKSHYATLFSGVETSSEEILKAKDYDGTTNSSGDIVFSGVIPSGFSLANAGSVPLIISDDTSKFDLHIGAATVVAGDVSFTGLPANARVKAYFVFSKTGTKFKFNAYSPPRPVEIEAMFIDPFDGQVGIKIYKAIPKNFNFSGLGDDFVEQPLEFTVLANEQGEVFEMWQIE